MANIYFQNFLLKLEIIKNSHKKYQKNLILIYLLVFLTKNYTILFEQLLSLLLFILDINFSVLKNLITKCNKINIIKINTVRQQKF